MFVSWVVSNEEKETKTTVRCKIFVLAVAALISLPGAIMKLCCAQMHAVDTTRVICPFIEIATPKLVT